MDLSSLYLILIYVAFFKECLMKSHSIPSPIKLFLLRLSQTKAIDIEGSNLLLMDVKELH